MMYHLDGFSNSQRPQEALDAQEAGPEGAAKQRMGAYQKKVQQVKQKSNLAVPLLAMLGYTGGK